MEKYIKSPLNYAGGNRNGRDSRASPTDEELAFWTDVWETHRKVTSPDSKPKTEKQIRKWLKEPHADAAEYKMWGNGVALPCVFFVLSGIAYYSQSPMN